MIEKILERLKDKQNYCDMRADLDEYYDGKASAFDEAIRIVQEVAKDGGWIPCSERLPEERDYDDGYVEPSEPVLVFTKYNECRVSRYWGNRRNKRDYYDWVDIKHSTHEVIAWQPLPAPYQKGEVV